MKKDVFTFIKEHNHINYCECIIHKDGLIEYAIPNHIECMIRTTGKTREEIYDMMDIWDSPLSWLVNFTECVAVYTNGCVLPKEVTLEQKKTLNALIKNDLTLVDIFKI